MWILPGIGEQMLTSGFPSVIYPKYVSSLEYCLIIYPRFIGFGKEVLNDCHEITIAKVRLPI